MRNTAIFVNKIELKKNDGEISHTTSQQATLDRHDRSIPRDVPRDKGLYPVNIFIPWDNFWFIPLQASAVKLKLQIGHLSDDELESDDSNEELHPNWIKHLWMMSPEITKIFDAEKKKFFDRAVTNNLHKLVSQYNICYRAVSIQRRSSTDKRECSKASKGAKEKMSCLSKIWWWHRLFPWNESWQMDWVFKMTNASSGGMLSTMDSMRRTFSSFLTTKKSLSALHCQCPALCVKYWVLDASDFSSWSLNTFLIFRPLIVLSVIFFLFFFGQFLL